MAGKYPNSSGGCYRFRVLFLKCIAQNNSLYEKPAGNCHDSKKSVIGGKYILNNHPNVIKSCRI
jgi:hypothetical protein